MFEELAKIIFGPVGVVVAIVLLASKSGGKTHRGQARTEANAGENAKKENLDVIPYDIEFTDLSVRIADKKRAKRPRSLASSSSKRQSTAN